jgi:hypothetical protein
MNGGELVSVFDKYGWPGIIAIIVITGFILFFKYLQKTEKDNKKSIEGFGESLTDALAKKMSEENEKIVSMISDQNDKLVNTLKDTNEKLIEHILNTRDKKHADSLEYRRDISGQMIDIMKELRAEFKASRVSILEFHNTNINLTGLGFLSYDMKYERQEIGVPTISDLAQNREISQLSWISKQIKSASDADKHVYIMDLMTKEDKEVLYEEAPVLYDDLVNKLDVIQMIYVGLYDYNTLKMLGMLAIEYDSNKTDQIKHINKHRDEYIDKSAIYGSRISQLLTLPNTLKEKE